MEDVGPVDAVHLDDARLEGPSGDDDVTLVLEDPRDPVDRLGHVGRTVDGEGVVVRVLEVAGLVGPQSGEGVGHGRALEALGGHLREVDDLAQETPWVVWVWRKCTPQEHCRRQARLNADNPHYVSS